MPIDAAYIKPNISQDILDSSNILISKAKDILSNSENILSLTQINTSHEEAKKFVLENMSLLDDDLKWLSSEDSEETLRKQPIRHTFGRVLI
ncbi:hypothetical protein [Vibrio sp. TBV020]|uniref:hypothetical protein n=1 Tax=Vibrio sp. TBV020 TaxID=3137398 RepID=UPI0038CD22D8